MPVSRTSRFSNADDDADIASYISYVPRSAYQSISSVPRSASQSISSVPRFVSQSLVNLSEVDLSRPTYYVSKPDLASRISRCRDDALVDGLNNRVRTLEASLTRPLESKAFGRIAGRRALARRLNRGAPRWQDPTTEDYTEAEVVPYPTKTTRKNYLLSQLQDPAEKRREYLVDEFLNSRKKAVEPKLFDSVKPTYRPTEFEDDGPVNYRSQRSSNLDELEDSYNPGLSHGILRHLRHGGASGGTSRSDLNDFAAQISTLSLPRCTDRGNDEDYWTRMAQSRGELGQLEQLVSHTFNRRLDENDYNGREALVRVDGYPDTGRTPELDLFPTASLAVRWAQSRLNNRID